MPTLDNILAFRITHIKNIPHILQYGITHRNSINNNPNYKEIGLQSLISKRETKEVIVRTKNKPEQSIVLGNFIPFYFGKLSPMLLKIQPGYGV